MESLLHIYPVNSKPYEISYEEWVIKWWQWISSIPKEKNPAFDESGEFLNQSQKITDVVFLCQTIEGKDQIPIRKGTVKSGSFFMPIINWISIMGIDGNTDKELLKIAKSKMDVIGTLKLKINDEDIKIDFKNNRILSPFFYIDLPKNNIFDIDSGIRRCISDGYWIFFHANLKTINIITNSSCSSGVTRINVEYILNIN